MPCLAKWTLPTHFSPQCPEQTSTTSRRLISGSYRRLGAAKLDGGNVLAQFENGDPALIEWRLGKGSAYLLTSGWHPADSQFARSWKFVLFISTLVEGDSGSESNRRYFVVNEPVRLGEDIRSAENVGVIKPDGTKV